MAGVAGKEFRDDAQSVKIRREASADDGRLLAAIQRCGAGEKPSGEEMGDRAHCPENGLSAEYLRQKTLPLINTDQTDLH